MFCRRQVPRLGAAVISHELQSMIYHRGLVPVLPAWFVILFVPLLLSISGCQHTANTQELHEDISVLQRELAAREVELMQLRVQQQQQGEEINRLSSSQEQAVQEVVRTKANLSSYAGKAETVASLAEVSMTLQSSRQAASTAARKQVLKRAEQYLTMGEAELDVENYEGAAYLVGKARELVQLTGTGNKMINSAAEETEVNFFSPIRMQVLSTSNVRNKASLQASVLFQLDPSEQVRAIAYKGPWLKIQTVDKRMGWIYYKLVDVLR